MSASGEYSTTQSLLVGMKCIVMRLVYELVSIVLNRESCFVAQASERESQVCLLQAQPALRVFCRGHLLGKCLGCTQARLTS